MAKSGFSVSQRRKVEVISATPHVAKAADCGQHFVLATDLGGAAAISLPSIADAGNGWHCTIHVGATQTGNVSITTADGATLQHLHIAADGGAAVAITSQDGGATVRLLGGGGGNQVVAGDFVELKVLNGVYFARGVSAK
jgi:hypothetical protein